MSRDANIAAQEKLAEGINAGNTAVVHEVFAENVVD
ncbi:MAG: ester cyclase, partial [Thermoleophilaceae bacterium]|nr:ester cyclase [Thermoleophilaceae bacterium]